VQRTTVTLVAATTFALGLAIGKAWNVHSAAPAIAAANAPIQQAVLPPGHPALPERGLEDAVRTTLQARGVATMPATAWSGASAPAPESTPLIAQADALRRQRKFQAAADVYRRVAATGGMTADAWADYADALASAKSSLRGEPAQALAAALALDPRHAKALWLKASLEHEEHHYRDAVKTWQSLLALVPQESSDANIIRANIAEATRLASGRS
jgi:tetratricopeptide (TPR) repeat protein